MQYEKKVGKTEGIHSLNFQGEKIAPKVFKNHPRRTTCN
jgi:hypothetical protein